MKQLKKVLWLGIIALGVISFNLDSTVFADDTFEFHGYSRAGFGWNKEGGNGQRYRWNYDASGLDEHYWRLGNESHNAYTNLTLIHNWKKKEAGDQSFAKFVSSIIIEPDGEDNWEEKSVVIRQLYGETGNFSWAPGVTFWAGEKWYRHPGDQHITDWQLMDIAGYGGGIGDIPLGGAGRLSIAMIGQGSKTEKGYTTSDVGEPVSTMVDVRVEEIPIGVGNMLIQFAPVWTKGGTLSESEIDSDLNGDSDTTDEFELESQSGWMSSVYLNFDGFFGIMDDGYGRIVARYGRGYGSTSFYNRYMHPNSDDATLDAEKGNNITWEDSYRWTALIDGLMQFSKKFQFMPVVAYMYYNNGSDDSDADEITKILYGGRFQYNFIENLALQFEPGFIYLDSEPSTLSNGDQLKDTLQKYTFALTVQPETGFWARPQIRFFVTYARWGKSESAEYLDDNAGIDPTSDTDAMTYGMQFEAWW